MRSRRMAPAASREELCSLMPTVQRRGSWKSPTHSQTLTAGAAISIASQMLTISDHPLAAFPELEADLALQYLADRAARQRVPEFDTLGRLDSTQPLPAKGDELGLVGLRARLQLDNGSHG